MCSIDCLRGRCEQQRCICEEGWSGAACDQISCDRRCTEHGSCNNGTCTCKQGWNGRHCSLGIRPASLSINGRIQIDMSLSAQWTLLFIDPLFIGDYKLFWSIARVRAIDQSAMKSEPVMSLFSGGDRYNTATWEYLWPHMNDDWTTRDYIAFYRLEYATNYSYEFYTFFKKSKRFYSNIASTCKIRLQSSGCYATDCHGYTYPRFYWGEYVVMCD